MSQLEEVNPDDNSWNDFLQSNFMDQLIEQQLDQPADSREGFMIDPRQGSQAPPSTELLTSPHLAPTLPTSIGDFDSHRNIGENREEARREKKRKNDQNYRLRQKGKKKALEDANDQLNQENQELKAEIQEVKAEKWELKAEIQEVKAEKWEVKAENRELKAENRELKAEIERLKCTLEEKERQLMLSPAQPNALFVPQGKSTFAAAPTPRQNITQSRTRLCAHAKQWQPRHNRLRYQGSQAAATTLPLTRPVGRSRMQRTFQSPGIFPEDSPGLPCFRQQEQLGQTAHTINASPELRLQQEQGGNTAVELPPLTEGLSDQIANIQGSSLFNYLIDASRSSHACIAEPIVPFQLEIEEEQELFLGDQQKKSNLEAAEAEKTRVKLELELRKLLLEKQQKKSNLEASEAEMTRLKLEIEEEQELFLEDQQKKSNLEASEAEMTRLKLEIEEEQELFLEDQQKKSNLEACEAENERLEHEIYLEEQLMISNSEPHETEVGQLADELKSLNVAND